MEGFWTGAIFGVIAGWGMALAISSHDYRADLIQRGLAEYCATDGRFAFKGECGE
jgi:hypothetical protein